MATPGFAVAMDKYHGALDQRDRMRKAMTDLRDYFRELSALRERQAAGALAQDAFALWAERGAYLHAQEMVQSYIDSQTS